MLINKNVIKPTVFGKVFLISEVTGCSSFTIVIKVLSSSKIFNLNHFVQKIKHSLSDPNHKELL